MTTDYLLQKRNGIKHINILEFMKMIYVRRDMFVENKNVEGQYVPTRNVFALDPKELEGRSVLIELERIYGRRI